MCCARAASCWCWKAPSTGTRLPLPLLTNEVARYQRAGAGELADAYHPIAQDVLESALASAGLTVELLEQPQPWRLPGRLPRFPLLVARRTGGDDRGQEDDQ